MAADCFLTKWRQFSRLRSNFKAFPLEAVWFHRVVMESSKSAGFLLRKLIGRHPPELSMVKSFFKKNR